MSAEDDTAGLQTHHYPQRPLSPSLAQLAAAQAQAQALGMPVPVVMLPNGQPAIIPQGHLSGYHQMLPASPTHPVSPQGHNTIPPHPLNSPSLMLPISAPKQPSGQSLLVHPSSQTVSAEPDNNSDMDDDESVIPSSSMRDRVLKSHLMQKQRTLSPIISSPVASERNLPQSKVNTLIRSPAFPSGRSEEEEKNLFRVSNVDSLSSPVRASKAANLPHVDSLASESAVFKYMFEHTDEGPAGLLPRTDNRFQLPLQDAGQMAAFFATQLHRALVLLKHERAAGEAARGASDSAAGSLQEAAQALLTLQSRVGELEGLLQSRNEEIDGLEERIDGLEETKRQHEELIEESAQKLLIGESTIEELTTAHQTSLNGLQIEMDDILTAKTELEAVVSGLESEKHDLEGERQGLENAKLALEDHIKQLEAELEARRESSEGGLDLLFTSDVRPSRATLGRATRAKSDDRPARSVSPVESSSAAAASEISRLRAELACLEERVAELEEDNEKLQRELQAQHSDLSTIPSLHKKLSAADQEIVNLTLALEVANERQRLGSEKEKPSPNRALVERVAKLENEKDTMSASHENLKAAHEGLKLKLAEQHSANQQALKLSKEHAIKEVSILRTALEDAKDEARREVEDAKDEARKEVEEVKVETRREVEEARREVDLISKQLEEAMLSKHSPPPLPVQASLVQAAEVVPAEDWEEILDVSKELRAALLMNINIASEVHQNLGNSQTVSSSVLDWLSSLRGDLENGQRVVQSLASHGQHSAVLQDVHDQLAELVVVMSPLNFDGKLASLTEAIDGAATGELSLQAATSKNNEVLGRLVRALEGMFGQHLSRPPPPPVSLPVHGRNKGVDGGYDLAAHSTHSRVASQVPSQRQSVAEQEPFRYHHLSGHGGAQITLIVGSQDSHQGPIMGPSVSHTPATVQHRALPPGQLRNHSPTVVPRELLRDFEQQPPSHLPGGSSVGAHSHAVSSSMRGGISNLQRSNSSAYHHVDSIPADQRSISSKAGHYATAIHRPVTGSDSSHLHNEAMHQAIVRQAGGGGATGGDRRYTLVEETHGGMHALQALNGFNRRSTSVRDLSNGPVPHGVSSNFNTSIINGSSVAAESRRENSYQGSLRRAHTSDEDRGGWALSNEQVGGVFSHHSVMFQPKPYESSHGSLYDAPANRQISNRNALMSSDGSGYHHERNANDALRLEINYQESRSTRQAKGGSIMPRDLSGLGNSGFDRSERTSSTAGRIGRVRN